MILSGEIIRSSLTFLDLLDQLENEDIRKKAEHLVDIYEISTRDLEKIIVFWENNRERMKIN